MRYYGPGDYTWREVFAFFPVTTVSGKSIWLKKVYASDVVLEFEHDKDLTFFLLKHPC